VGVSFIGGGNQSTGRTPTPPECRKSLTNFITYCCVSSTLRHERDCIGSYKSIYKPNYYAIM